MNRISKDTRKEIDDLVGTMAAEAIAINAKIADFHAEVGPIFERIEEARSRLFEILDEAANEAETYFDEKSEKWQEGERGQAYSEWKDALGNARDLAATEIEPIEIEEIDVDEVVDFLNEQLLDAP